VSTAHARRPDLRCDPEGHGYRKRKQVDFERTNYWTIGKNLKQQCLLFQLLRCLVCTVSWCTRSVHAVNGRVHGRVRVMDGPRTWPVHGRAHSLYMAVDGYIHGPQTRPCVCVPCTGLPMYRIHDQGRVQTVYTAVHGPCTWSVHDLNTTGVRLCTLYTAVCTESAHGRA